MSLAASSLSRVLLLPEGGERVLFENIDLQVAPGEAAGILGPAGSGKTALLRGILGLDPLSGGEIAFGGRPLRPGDFQPVRRAVLGGLVSRMEISASPLRLAREARGRAGRGAREALSVLLLREASIFGLTAVAMERPFRELDPGDRACALLAIIGLGSAPWIVLDGLEALLHPPRQAALSLWIAARKAEGSAVLLSSRSEMLLARCCDRVAVLFDGALEGGGPVEEVLPAACAHLRSGRPGA